MAKHVSRVDSDRPRDGGDPALAPEFVKSCPAMAEYLTVGRYADGSVRQRSTVLIMASPGGGWRGCLTDKSNGRLLWAASDDLSTLMLALEALLTSPNCPWVAERANHQENGRTRK